MSSFVFNLVCLFVFLVGFRLCCAVVIGDVFLFVLLASCYGHASYQFGTVMSVLGVCCVVFYVAIRLKYLLGELGNHLFRLFLLRGHCFFLLWFPGGCCCV